jgi:adenylate cyclase class 2
LRVGLPVNGWPTRSPISLPIEQEVKLAFESVEAAERAVNRAGGRLAVSRRQIADTLFDTADEMLRRNRSTLRLRQDATETLVTFKGPPLPGVVKSREELETSMGSADTALAIFEALGFRSWFHYDKSRAEYTLDLVRIAIDETPMGVFIEIEGPPDEIERTASLLGRTTSDYCLESYPALYRKWQANREA